MGFIDSTLGVLPAHQQVFHRYAFFLFGFPKRLVAIYTRHLIIISIIMFIIFPLVV